MINKTNGLIHLYVGDGKGKTTAAIGLAVRALGAGRKVLVAQFLKGQETSEIAPLLQLGAQVVRTDEIQKFVFQMNETELAQAKESCVRCLSVVRDAMNQHTMDVFVLDEVVDAINCKLLETDQLLEMLRGRNEDIEVVMTGRNPSEKIVEIADYLTIMTALKHPYQRGIDGRLGIEY